MPDIRPFNATIDSLPVGFLRTGEGRLLLLVMAIMVDASLERQLQALTCRHPSGESASAQALLGQDRGILRGRSETLGHYAQRLLAWRHPRGHKVRGSAFALLEQVSEYFGGVNCASVDPRGNLFERDALGVETVTHSTTWLWGSLAVLTNWARFWLHVHAGSFASEHPAWGSPLLFGGAWGGRKHVLGLDGVTPEDIAAIRGLFIGKHPWKPMGNRPEWLVFSFDESGAYVAPDVTYEHWSKQADDMSGTQVAARSASFRYVSLSPTKNNAYAGYPDKFPLALTLAAGTTYVGNPDNFPVAITLTDGTTYVGNPDNFPVTIALPDDGSAV
jgi:hypothetical protein